MSLRVVDPNEKQSNEVVSLPIAMLPLQKGERVNLREAVEALTEDDQNFLDKCLSKLREERARIDLKKRRQEQEKLDAQRASRDTQREAEILAHISKSSAIRWQIGPLKGTIPSGFIIFIVVSICLLV